MSQPGHDFWEAPDPALAVRERMGGDEDMRAFLKAVFLQMAAAVLLSGAAAMLVVADNQVQAALVGPQGMTILGWIIAIAPLGLVLVLGGTVDRLSGGAARAIFMTYAILVGLSLGTVFMGLADSTVVGTFIATAAAFSVLAFVGGSTGRDLSGFGSFLTMTLVGLVLATLANLFLQSASLDLGLAAIGILLFAGLTAFDTQRLKRIYDERRSDMIGSVAVLGALTLYLDFINLFMSLLHFTGRRR